ncbi:hypothetical protein [Celerinatantimonas sp. MCCC 1A17872]|uniref:hypothetical protein n=1 Tax=Celerinatantimonas sp. MCCC 1A17872 TaxID=3177514 RepID=UPI0038BFBFAE
MRKFFWPIWVTLCFIASTAVVHAAIVNQNSLYQQSEYIIEQIKVIRTTKGLDNPKIETPIVSGKLATSIILKTNELITLAGLLQSQNNLQITHPQELIYQVYRPFQVMPALTTLSAQLSSIIKLTQSAKEPTMPERPLGKSANDVYSQLLVAESLFDGLVKFNASAQISSDLVAIQAGLKAIAAAHQLPFQLKPAEQVKDRDATDANLMAYQCFYLVERLFRQLGTDATTPTRFPASDSTLKMVADTVLNIHAEIHRSLTTLQLKAAPSSSSSETLDTNQIYMQLTELRSLLLGMLQDKGAQDE